MTDKVRVLNSAGWGRFLAFLAKQRRHEWEAPPFELLYNPEYSEEFDESIEVEQRPGGKAFANRFEFGAYLCQRFAKVSKVRIARNLGLWNWLSLYYFDQLCPADHQMSRTVYTDEVYVLTPEMTYRQHFRHLVRAPWSIVSEHGKYGKVLLIHTDRGDAPLAARGGIFESLASRQGIVNNPTVIAGAHWLYFDEKSSRPRWGASGKDQGTVGRFALVVQQLELTFDTRACTVGQLVALLPKEFDKWKLLGADEGL